jgi:ABC-type Fe3+-hydroxamate transport system substrate-binding protein
MRVVCEPLGSTFRLEAPPRRIVSLVSSATETLAALGCLDRIAGVSPYCARYVDGLAAPVVGDYLQADPEAVRAVNPDLVLVTCGVQLPLGHRLAAAGLPVYALPLPASRFGIWENTLTIGALLGRMEEARALCTAQETLCAELLAAAPQKRPRVYAELWFGRHPRMAGGRTFIHDLVALAGGENIFGAEPGGYLPLDHAAAGRLAPDITVFFSEPEYPVNTGALLAERGWDKAYPDLRTIVSTVERGRNLIHDGPSFFETAAWLHGELRK